MGEAGPGFPAGVPSCPAGGSAAAGASSTRATSSLAIASREARSSALARSSDSSWIRLRSRSASARAAASRRLSSSISEPILGLLPPYTTVEDQAADQPVIWQSCWPEVPSEELHPTAFLSRRCAAWVLMSAGSLHELVIR